MADFPRVWHMKWESYKSRVPKCPWAFFLELTINHPNGWKKTMDDQIITIYMLYDEWLNALIQPLVGGLLCVL